MQPIKGKQITVCTLSDLLIACRGNQSEVARIVGITRYKVCVFIKLKKNPLFQLIDDSWVLINK